MRLRKVVLSYKGGERITFDAGPLTVLFGKNNSGKTNILESLYSDFVAQDKRFVRTREMFLGLQTVSPGSAVCVDLECGVAFDDDVLAEVDGSPQDETPRRATFDSEGGWFVCPPEPDDWWTPPPDWRGYELDEDSFLGYGHKTVGPRLRVRVLDWEVTDLNARVEEALGPNWLEIASDRGEAIGMAEAPIGRPDLRWRWNPVMAAQLDQIITLATDLLPDFVNPDLEGRVNYPKDWEEFGRVDLHCEGYPLENMGQGTARWIATAVQMALKLVSNYPGLRTLRDLSPKGFSGEVLLVDEPEAHLHPTAVASVVRWCQRMVEHGFTVIVATHHEEFLRADGDDLTLVHVTKERTKENVEVTQARALPSQRISYLLELAQDVGMHPANVLSLHKAILFVEGLLDQAVLEEYGGTELETAGVKIIPIHGTKNLEGLVATELVTGLGIKMGVLLDATDPETIDQRSGRRRSSEERKVIKVIEMAKAKGAPEPRVFGVREADLLFALPTDAIRAYLRGPFPEWKELVAECRQASGKGPSDSVDWKSYAHTHYGLPIDTDSGVRRIVRQLDLDHVPLPSIRRVIDQVVEWAGNENR